MARRKTSRKMKVYYFQGRNTGIFATTAKAARKKKKRGGDKIVAVRRPNKVDRRATSKGKWSTVRRDGKTKAKSRYGKGRGQGPRRKKR